MIRRDLPAIVEIVTKLFDRTANRESSDDFAFIGT
jgi:hypothetical protein